MRIVKFLVRCLRPFAAALGLVADGVTLLLFFGTVAVPNLFNLPLWIRIAAPFTFVILVLAVGAYRQWDAADREASDLRAALQAANQAVPSTLITSGDGGAGGSGTITGGVGTIFGGAGGGSGGVAGPNGYAQGGRGGRGYSLYELLGRMSYKDDVSVRRLAASMNLDEAALSQEYGSGGHGADSG